MAYMGFFWLVFRWHVAACLFLWTLSELIWTEINWTELSCSRRTSLFIIRNPRALISLAGKLQPLVLVPCRMSSLEAAFQLWATLCTQCPMLPLSCTILPQEVYTSPPKRKRLALQLFSNLPCRLSGTFLCQGGCCDPEELSFQAKLH